MHGVKECSNLIILHPAIHKCSNIFFDSPPRVMKINPKINKWVLPKSVCTEKKTINKRQPTEGEKIFANDKTEINLVQYRFSIKKKIKKMDGRFK